MNSFDNLIEIFCNAKKYVCVYTFGGHHRGKIIAHQPQHLDMEYKDKKARTVNVSIQKKSITAISNIPEVINGPGNK